MIPLFCCKRTFEMPLMNSSPGNFCGMLTQCYAPSSARFAAYCYGKPSHLVYQGRTELCNRGQQGCPIMGPLFCLTRQRMVEEARALSSRCAPEFEPAFADDAFSGGHVDDVYEAFYQELQLAHKYGLHVDPQKCTFFFVAGDRFREDIFRFQALGVNVVTGTDITMLKVPIGDSPNHLQTFHARKLGEFDSLCSSIEQLPHAHVGLYLFKNGGTFSKLQWWCRTTPRTYIDPLLHEFHNRQKQTVENLLGTPISTHQWTQAKLPTKFGGLGIIAPRTEIGLDIVSLADIAFLAAHRRAVPHVQKLVPMIPEQILRACEGPSVQHLGACLPQFAPLFRDPAAFVNHRDVLEHLHHKVFGGLMQQTDLCGQARLTAYSAPSADAWLRATPSHNQDTLLSNAAFRDVLSMRLGVKIFDDGMACSFCQQNLDRYGHHCMGCMGQGHKQQMHTCFRNVVHRLAVRAGARPLLEPAHLLPDAPQTRPADVLIISLPDVQQSSWRRFPKLALDCAITSPFQHNTMRLAAAAHAAAADRYADLKRKHADMRARCERQNVGFKRWSLRVLEGTMATRANF